MKKEYLVAFIITMIVCLMSNNTLNASAEDIGIAKIQFGDFVPVKDYRWFRINNTVESSDGNLYPSNTIVVDSSLNAYAEYEMNGNFSVFTGKLTTGKTFDDTVSGNGISGELTIIGDGKELYKCNGITMDAGEIYFSVDVTGIKNMTIKTANSGKWSYGFFYIVDSYLYSASDISGEYKIRNFEDIYTNEATSYNEHLYKIYYTSHDWEDAKKCCIDRGGYLASISSEEEDVFLYNLIKNAGIDGAWFGLSYDYNSEVWNWESGECVEYTNWASGEPNYQGKTEKYGMYYSKYSNGQWNDGNGEAGAYICEWGDIAELDSGIWIDLEKYGLSDESGTDDDNFSVDRKTLGIFRPKLSAKNDKSGSEVILTIGKASYADGYVVYMKKKGDSKYKKIKTVSKDGSKKRKVIIDDLDNGTYYFKVKAYHKSDEKKEWAADSIVKCSVSSEMVKNSKLNLQFDDGERKKVNMKLKWGWSVLEKSDNNSYSHDLAKIALLMSQDVYDKDSIYERYAELGFDLGSVKYTKSFSGENFLQPGMSFASRKFTNDDGVEKSIIVVSVQGTNGFDSMLTDIYDGGLKGFVTSGEYAINQLKSYTKQMGINLKSKDTILFITGHSLGGAVCGRLAIELKALKSKAKTFVYTFAPAKYTIDDNTYSYVFNLVNRNDLVPYVPKWSDRVGTDLYYDANASKYTGNRELVWGLKADEDTFEMFYDHYLATYLYCMLTEKPSLTPMDYNYGKIPPSSANLLLIG